MTVLDPVGKVGVDEKNLIITATLLMLLVVIPVILMTFIFSWKYRISNKSATYTPKWAHSSRIEIVIWTVPILIIMFLGVITYKSSYALDPYRELESNVKPLEIEVVAMDWKWLFIYPEQKIATINKIVFPTNTPINFKITSDTVMNSFFIPGLGGQIYAMAGMKTRLHLIADKKSNLEGIAANFSGAGFTDMKFKAVSSSKDSFDKWVGEVKQSSKKLDANEYQQLTRQSRNNPVVLYSEVTPNLFQKIIDKYEGMHVRKQIDSSNKKKRLPASVEKYDDLTSNTHTVAWREE